MNPLPTSPFAPSVPSSNFKMNDSLISRPVGSDVLPGGNTQAMDIESSLIFSKIIPFIIQYTIGLALALCVIALIWGGYQYLTAYGDTDQYDKARKTIVYAALGLILSLTAFGIVSIITRIQLV